ncbi:hypothetical protein OAM67_01050 [bacterium]|jgi:hypothetical protein|nr:hypothetical protein [bacterium]
MALLECSHVHKNSCFKDVLQVVLEIALREDKSKILSRTQEMILLHRVKKMDPALSKILKLPKEVAYVEKYEVELHNGRFLMTTDINMTIYQIKIGTIFAQAPTQTPAQTPPQTPTPSTHKKQMLVQSKIEVHGVQANSIVAAMVKAAIQGEFRKDRHKEQKELKKILKLKKATESQVE